MRRLRHSIARPAHEVRIVGAWVATWASSNIEPHNIAWFERTGGATTLGGASIGRNVLILCFVVGGLRVAKSLAPTSIHGAQMLQQCEGILLGAPIDCPWCRAQRGSLANEALSKPPMSTPQSCVANMEFGEVAASDGTLRIATQIRKGVMVPESL